MTLDLFQEAEAEAEAAWTVSQLNRAVRGKLEEGFGTIWLTGEVANWKRHGSGHRYFSLRDAEAQVSCAMWRAAASRLPIDPSDGAQVVVRARVTLFEPRGQYQLTVEQLDTVGDEGLFRKAFDALKTRLDAEGLTDVGRKRAIPRMPETVGVVTSTSGAALRDILTVMQRRAPWTRVLVMNARVQGEGAGADVARAIRALGAVPGLDTLIVARGGGSIEDLWAFNEEVVARAIGECPVPVISGVGHETDVTIADYVADLRAPTPSAAAEKAVPDGAAARAWVRESQLRMRTSLRAMTQQRTALVQRGLPRLRRGLVSRLELSQNRVSHGGVRLGERMRHLLGRRERELDLLPRLARALTLQMERRRDAVRAMSGRLHALSPLATLERGYAIALTDERRLVRRVSDLSAGQLFSLRLTDGELPCVVRSPSDDPVASTADA